MAEEKEEKGCSPYYLAHCDALKDAKERIGKLDETIQGLPQEVKSIKEALEKMNINMDKLLERLEAKYVSKELYENSMKILNANFIDYKEAKDREIQSITNQQVWVTRGIIVMTLYVLREVVLYAVKN